jgi:succinate dehydrogenase flavin-adding protein (antitoxin of CptAB toxin-antitoxin module)
MEEDYNQLLASHDQDVAKILENQQAQQNKQKIALEVDYHKHGFQIGCSRLCPHE